MIFRKRKPAQTVHETYWTFYPGTGRGDDKDIWHCKACPKTGHSQSAANAHVEQFNTVTSPAPVLTDSERRDAAYGVADCPRCGLETATHDLYELVNSILDVCDEFDEIGFQVPGTTTGTSALAPVWKIRHQISASLAAQARNVRPPKED